MNRFIACLLLSVLLANTALAGVFACNPMNELKSTQVKEHVVHVQEPPCHSQAESHAEHDDCDNDLCSLLCAASLLVLDNTLASVSAPERQSYASTENDVLFSREQSPPKRPPKYIS